LIKVALFKEKYPSIPQLTVRATANIEISAYKRPENSGYPVVNPHMCTAAYRALAEGIPLTEGFVSITDEKRVTRVATVPFGAKLNEVFPAPEGYKLVRAEKIMGKAVEDDDVMEYGVEALAIVKDVPYPVITERGCIGCRRCVNICPGRLLPYQLYNAAEKGKMSISLKNELLSCFECGCCSAVCPSCLPISELLSKARTEYILGSPSEDIEKAEIEAEEQAEEVIEEQSEEVAEVTVAEPVEEEEKEASIEERSECEEDEADEVADDEPLTENEDESTDPVDDDNDNESEDEVVERITFIFDDDIDEDAEVNISLEITEENVEPVIEPITSENTAEPPLPSKNTGKKKIKKKKGNKSKPENNDIAPDTDTAEPEKVDLAGIFGESKEGDDK
jgi:Na+-translocating ferredoxin:NAD+ oxidoreductase RnfC subunit